MTIELTLLSRVAYRDREITSPRLQQLLAALALDLSTGASTTRLIDDLWPAQRPANPTKALQVLISRARSQLGHELVVNTATGYRLAVPPSVVDTTAAAIAANSGIRAAKQGEHRLALEHAESGLALWNGLAADPDADGPLAELRAGLAGTRHNLARCRALALARLDRSEEALDQLRELAAAHPRDEEILEQLLRCLARIDGQAAALEAYERYRRRLRDDLGVDPGQGLRNLHAQLLAGDAAPVRRGLAFDPNPLLGRDSDVQAVAALTRSSRVTSIIGPGGLGKTRLANVIGRTASQRTVHFVALAGVSTEEGVVGEVAASLGVRAPRARLNQVRYEAPTDVVTGIVEALTPGPALLILDNCEHVVAAAATLVRALISLSPDLRILVTSRAPLGVSSESVYLLPELDLATSIELFESRSRAARPGLDLPVDAVHRLCAHLDGLPLAVELAAARTRMMSVEQIEQRLQHRFALLRGSSRDAPDRHRTLEAVIDWSWRLLEPDEQLALQTLSVFPDGFVLEAAEHLLGSATDTIERLGRLIDQSLLKVVETPRGARYRMLETVREFSAHRLADSGGTDAAERGLLAWAQQFSRGLQPERMFADDPYSAVGDVRAEHDNLLGAFHLAIARGDALAAAGTFAALGVLWTMESNHPMANAAAPDIADILARYRPAPDDVELVRAALVISAANSMMFNNYATARAIVALRRLPAVEVNTPIRALGVVLPLTGNLRTTDSSVLARLIDDPNPYLAAVAGTLAAEVWENDGRVTEALTTAQRVAELMPEDCGPWLRAAAIARAGELNLHLGRFAESERAMHIALPMLERLGSWSDVAGLRWNLVLARLNAGDIPGAGALLDEISRLPADDPFGVRVVEVGIRAEFELARGELESGLRLWRRAAEHVGDLPNGLFVSSPPGLEPWTMVTQANCVVAHLLYGRPEPIMALVDELRAKVLLLLQESGRNPAQREVNTASVVAFLDFPVCGAALLAVGLAELTAALPDVADPDAADGSPHTGSGPGGSDPIRSAIGLMALAEVFNYPRSQPTMSADRIRSLAIRAAGPEYDAAVASYSGPDRDGLRDIAIRLLDATA